MDLGVLAASEADAVVLVGVLLRRRVHAHPGVDICALATDVVKVAAVCAAQLGVSCPVYLLVICD